MPIDLDLSMSKSVRESGDMTTKSGNKCCACGKSGGKSAKIKTAKQGKSSKRALQTEDERARNRARRLAKNSKSKNRDECKDVKCDC